MSYIDPPCDANELLSGLRVVIEHYDDIPDVGNIAMYIERSYNGDYRPTYDASKAYLFSSYTAASLVALKYRDMPDCKRIVYIDKEWIGHDGEYWQIVCMRELIKTLVML